MAGVSPGRSGRAGPPSEGDSDVTIPWASSSCRRNTSPTSDSRAVRPGQGPRRSLHELGRDAEAVSRTQQRAQEDEIHVELRGDGLQVRGLGGKAGGGGARANDERRQAAQGRRHRIGQGQAQEVDLGIGAQHAEGQDHEAGEGDGRNRGLDGVSEDDAREVAGHGLRGGVAVRGRLGQGSADHAIEGHDRGGPREGRGLLVQGRLHDLDGLRPREGRTPGQGLEQHRARGEEVGARVDRVAQDLLRRHVAGRAHHEAGPREVALPREGTARDLGEGPGQAEVEDLRAVRGEEHVGRFQVAVDHPLRVQRAQGGEHFPAQAQGLAQRQRPALQPFGQRLAIQQLHGDEEPSRVLADLEDLARMGMVDAGGGAGFAPEAHSALFVGVARWS